MVGVGFGVWGGDWCGLWGWGLRLCVNGSGGGVRASASEKKSSGFFLQRTAVLQSFASDTRCFRGLVV